MSILKTFQMGVKTLGEKNRIVLDQHNTLIPTCD